MAHGGSVGRKHLRGLVCVVSVCSLGQRECWQSVTSSASSQFDEGLGEFVALAFSKSVTEIACFLTIGC